MKIVCDSPGDSCEHLTDCGRLSWEWCLHILGILVYQSRDGGDRRVDVKGSILGVVDYFLLDGGEHPGIN